ncbi:ABC transporter permease [Rhizobium sullae]|uniref:ABC transporter permease n=1 Tax=Rhizobium sullae TaxID=50338 RepID=UPI000B3642C8|nr:ABC transporter permease [Rhizobium sullae]
MQHRFREFFGIRTAKDFVPIIVNFIGTTVAFVAVGLCILIVRTDLSYDSWVRNSGQAYRLFVTISPPGAGKISLPAISPRLADSLKGLPGVEAVTRLSRENMVISRNGERFSETVQVVDENFLEAFGLELRAGSLAHALQAPGNAVLSQQAAQKYFGTANPIGQTLELDTGDSLQVTGVLRSVPENTHLNLNLLVSSASPFTILNRQFQSAGPGESIAYTYFWLDDGIAAKEVAVQLSNLLVTTPIMPPEQASVVNPVLGMMPVTEIHLNNFPSGELKPGGSRTMIGVLVAIATMIVVIVCINFSVLMISRAEARTLEYGVRRSFGATRLQIMLGNLREGAAITVASMTLAASLILAAHPIISAVLGVTILVTAPDLLFLLAPPVIVALGATAATMLPAGAVARMPPVVALKQEMPKRKAAWESIPIVVQFGLSTVIVVLSFIVAGQTTFAVRKSLQAIGTGVYIIESGTAALSPSVLATFRDEASRIPGVRAASVSQIVPTNFTTSMVGLMNQELGQAAPSGFPSNAVDSAFFDTYGLAPVAGRLFPDTDAAQAGGQVTVLSEAALPVLGFRDARSAIGTSIAMIGPQGPVPFEVLGVVPDITMKSVDLPPEPIVYFPVAERGRFVSIAIDNPRDPAVIDQINSVWLEVTNERAMNGRFLDDRLADLYRPLEQSRRVLVALSIVAIVTSCLGIYALTSLLSVRQRREIGIRRALGATRGNVTTYVSMRFFMPILAGVLLGLPASAFIAVYWLSGYSHRIALSPYPFLATAVGMVAVGMLAVLQHTIQLARTEPAAVLRT